MATKLKGFDFWRSLGSPRYVMAPMVDQSELAFRRLCRRYGVELCYGPMINSGTYVRGGLGDTYWTTEEADRPVFAQFCGNDPDTLLRAAKCVEHEVDAVDLNLGCPQGIARKGHYGAFLMEEWDLVHSLISKLHNELSVPVTAKIRIFPEVEKTVRYAQMIEQAGAQVLGVHGRLREQKRMAEIRADWEQIRAVKQALSIPVIANGDIQRFEDIQRCLDFTGADAVMSAETLLGDPALFSGPGPHPHPAVLAGEYLDEVEQAPASHKAVRAHMFKMLGPYLSQPANHDLRARLGSVDIKRSHDGVRDILDELRMREGLIQPAATSAAPAAATTAAEASVQPSSQQVPVTAAPASATSS